MPSSLNNEVCRLRLNDALTARPLSRQRQTSLSRQRQTSSASCARKARFLADVWLCGLSWFVACGLVIVACGLVTGCAALTNPLVEAVPVRRVPPQLLAGLRDDEEAIPLYLLHADQPAVYKLAPGDVLGVWVEGVVGNENLPVPV